MDTTVLVVGAGPTGLTLACGLAQRGIAVRVIDAAAAPATSSRALGLQPRGAEVLTRLGALRDLPEKAIPARGTTLYAGDNRPLEIPIWAPGKTGQRPAMLTPQTLIEQHLRDRLAEHGVKVEWSHRLLGFEQDAAGVTATVESDGQQQSVRVDWLAGCDGGHSVVRKLTGVAFPGNPVLERVLLADVRADWPMERTGSVMFTKAGKEFVGMPLPGGIWRLFVRLDDDRQDADATTREVLREVVCPLIGVSVDSVRSVEWTSIFRIQERLVDHYRFGRVFLAGDAAHLHSPTGGQGMNTGMGDAENLAFKLALVSAGRAADTLLDTYEAERRPVAQGVLQFTTSGTRLLAANTPATRLLRALATPLLFLPVVRSAIWRKASGMMLSYRGGRLGVRTGRFTPKACPGHNPIGGDRVPDIACVREDGTRTTLQTAIAGGVWALLTGVKAEGLLSVARERLGEDVVAVRPVVDGLIDAILVRPDGHVGWRGELDAAVLGRWLTEELQAR
jgi:4,5-epoxidase